MQCHTYLCTEFTEKYCWYIVTAALKQIIHCDFDAALEHIFLCYIFTYLLYINRYSASSQYPDWKSLLRSLNGYVSLTITKNIFKHFTPLLLKNCGMKCSEDTLCNSRQNVGLQATEEAVSTRQGSEPRPHNLWEKNDPIYFPGMFLFFCAADVWKILTFKI